MDLRTAWSNRVLHSDILGRGTFIGECFHLFSSVYLNDSFISRILLARPGSPKSFAYGLWSDNV